MASVIGSYVCRPSRGGVDRNTGINAVYAPWVSRPSHGGVDRNDMSEAICSARGRRPGAWIETLFGPLKRPILRVGLIELLDRVALSRGVGVGRNLDMSIQLPRIPTSPLSRGVDRNNPLTAIRNGGSASPLSRGRGSKWWRSCWRSPVPGRPSRGGVVRNSTGVVKRSRGSVAPAVLSPLSRGRGLKQPPYRASQRRVCSPLTRGAWTETLSNIELARKTQVAPLTGLGSKPRRYSCAERLPEESSLFVPILAGASSPAL